LGESVRRFGYVRAFDAADAIWPLCAAEQALLIREFPHAADKIAAVQNPYVTQAMLAPFQRSARDGPPLVLAAGRLAPQKRLDLLVEAFAHIPPGAAHLIIAGDGGERAKLEAIVKAHGLEDRVTLLGYVADVTDLLRRADLMVLTSVFEGLPAVVLEAMAVNCPVVSTNCFLSARALLETSQGCGVIEEETPAAVARLILERLADPRPTNLHETAQRWSIDNGVDSHVAGLERAVLRRQLG
jgi:glycosyltransferase involved in cell wall biosynthesis